MERSAIAQTFSVPKEFTDGVFISSIDLFFHTKASGENLPVTVSIVETLNGYPTTNVLPFATAVTQADDITANDQAPVATRFNFVTPVYVQPKVEYALRVNSNSGSYKLWIARMGDIRVDDPTRVVTQQPSTGSLFKSQNSSTWSAEQLEDIAFVINRASFDISGTGTLDLITPHNDTVQLSANPFKITNGQQKVRVFHANHGMKVGFYVTYSGSTYANMNATYQVTTVTNSDSYIVELASNAASTGLVGGGDVFATKTLAIDTARITAAKFEPKNTLLNTSVKITTETGKNATWDGAVLNADLNFAKSGYLHSALNETNLIGGQKSLDVRLGLSTYDEKVSPIVNLDSLSVSTVTNRINNPAPTDSISPIDDDVIFSGSTGLTFSSTNNKITSSTVSLKEFKIGAYISIAGTASNNTAGTDALIIDADFSTTTHVLYLDKVLVNETLSTAATITQRQGYVDEISPSGGSAEAKYLTKPVELGTVSSSLVVILASNIPSGTYVDLYYRAIIKDSTKRLQEYTWTKVQTSYVNNANEFEFTEQQYLIDVGSFNNYQIKLVMRSNDQADVPRIKDLRVIALA